jgi:arylsulfatase
LGQDWQAEDAGTLYPKRMETVDDEIRDLSFKFIEKAKTDGKPFFLWLNPIRMHIVTHLSDKYDALRTAQNGCKLVLKLINLPLLAVLNLGL